MALLMVMGALLTGNFAQKKAAFALDPALA
jgi:hypothetical protein